VIGFRGPGFIAEREYVTNGENVALRPVLDFVRRTVRPDKPESALLLALSDECLPEIGDDGCECRFGKIVEFFSDEFFASEAEKFGCANASLPVLAVIVGDEDR